MQSTIPGSTNEYITCTIKFVSVTLKHHHKFVPTSLHIFVLLSTAAISTADAVATGPFRYHNKNINYFIHPVSVFSAYVS